MTMELTDLALFLEVARQGSFTRAAGALRLAQPSVSARIAALERSVGRELFARSTRGVTLTGAGRALEPYARRCLALAEEGRLSARASAGVHRLAMVAPPSLATTIFPPFITALAAEPLELSCKTAHSHEVAEQLADGAAHIGFLLGTAVPEGITARPLYKVPVIAIARRGHPAASRPLRLSDLAPHRIAIHSWGPGASELDEILRTTHIPAARVCWVSPAATALALAAEHGHIAVLPADAARPGLRSGALARVRIANLPRWSMNVAVAYRHGFAEQQAPTMRILAQTAAKITQVTHLPPEAAAARQATADAHNGQSGAGSKSILAARSTTRTAALRAFSRTVTPPCQQCQTALRQPLLVTGAGNVRAWSGLPMAGPAQPSVAAMA